MFPGEREKHNNESWMNKKSQRDELFFGSRSNKDRKWFYWNKTVRTKVENKSIMMNPKCIYEAKLPC